MGLDFDEALRTYIVVTALQHGLNGDLLLQAFATEDPAILAALLGRDCSAVAVALRELQRALVIEGDWGAGCALLTAEVRATAEAALTVLITGRPASTTLPSIND